MHIFFKPEESEKMITHRNKGTVSQGETRMWLQAEGFPSVQLHCIPALSRGKMKEKHKKQIRFRNIYVIILKGHILTLIMANFLLRKI